MSRKSTAFAASSSTARIARSKSATALGCDAIGYAGLGTFVAFLGTTATMIAFINSVVAGAGIAILVDVLVNDEGRRWLSS